MHIRKRLLGRKVVFVAPVVLGGLSLAAFSATARSSPGDVARALIDAEQANDVDAAMATFAPSAVVTLPTGVLATPEAIRAWQADLAAGHFHMGIVNLRVHGNTVTWEGTVTWDPFRHMGIASLSGEWELVIEDGLITTFNFTFTPEAMRLLQGGQSS